MERPLMDEEGNGFLTGCQAVTEEYPCAREGTFLKLLFRNNFQLYVLQLFLRASSPVFDVRIFKIFPCDRYDVPCPLLLRDDSRRTLYFLAIYYPEF